MWHSFHKIYTSLYYSSASTKEALLLNFNHKLCFFCYSTFDQIFVELVHSLLTVALAVPYYTFIMFYLFPSSTIHIFNCSCIICCTGEVYHQQWHWCISQDLTPIIPSLDSLLIKQCRALSRYAHAIYTPCYKIFKLLFCIIEWYCTVYTTSCSSPQIWQGQLWLVALLLLLLLWYSIIAWLC